MAESREAWWSAEDEREVHAEALGFAEALRNRQFYERRERAEAALYLYAGSRRVSLAGGSGSWDDWDDPPYFNLIQTAVDFFTSMMVRNRVRPFFLTERGDAALQKRAKGLQRAVEGTMRELGLWDELGMLRCQDGHLFEAGGVKYACDWQNSRVVASRVRPWEVFVPEREARLGRPRQLVHSQQVERSVLAGMFPEDSEAQEFIEAAQSEDLDPREVVRGDRSDMVLTHELYHLPSTRVDLSNPASFGLDDNGEPSDDVDPGHDGRRVLLVRPGVLVSEPWPYDYFPIAWYKPRRDPIGYWSRSVPETLAGAQLELMEIGQKIQAIMRRHAVPHLLVWENAKINIQQITNDHASIIKTRVPPSQAAYYMVPQSVPAELFQRESQIISWAEKQLGVSEMSLAGVKPPSIEHAPGMEHLSEMEAIRHTAAYHAFERAHLEDGRIIVDLLCQLAKRDADMDVVFGEDKDLVRLKWKDIDIERDEYHLKIWPTNYFAQSPTAKFRQVKEMVQAGLFNPTPAARTALRALDYPDVESLTGDPVAEEEAIERCLQLAIEGKPDEQWIPTPYMDLELAKQKAKERINRLEADGQNHESIDRVQRFWELANELEQQLQPPPSPSAGPTQGGLAPAQLAAPAAA
jgi:hypothetical protein